MRLVAFMCCVYVAQHGCHTNQKNLLSIFECVSRARETIQEALGPSMKVVSVMAREIVLGGGDFHCLSMQQVAL